MQIWYETCYLNGDEAKVKVKVMVKQAWTGPEGSGRLRPPHWKTIGT